MNVQANLKFLPSPRLRYLAVELTNVCNLKCEICWAQNPSLYPARVRGFMSEALFRKILDDLDRDCFPRHMHIALSYAGESLLHPHFTKFLRLLAKLHPKRIQLATNGILLSKRIMTALLDAEADVAVSLHRGKHLARVIEKAKRFHKLKTKRNVNCSIRVNLVCEEWTQQELDEITRKTYRYVDMVKQITYITEDMQTAMPHTRYWPLCPSLFTYLAVLWNGETYPCCHILSAPAEFTLGNVNAASVKNVFEGKAFETLRYGSQEGTPCQNCQVRR